MNYAWKTVGRLNYMRCILLLNDHCGLLLGYGVVL